MNISFEEAIKSAKIPMLVLDQKWHRLFALGGKPKNVLELESVENELLKRQGELNQELKELKKVKNNLMQSVVSNMDGAQTGQDELSKKLDENKRLIDDANSRMELIEDELLEMPKNLDEANKALMMATMNFCYEKLRINTKEAKEISDWIKQVRVELKRNIIKKQNREINNKEMYSYMHDVFGKEVLEMFDVKYEDDDSNNDKDKE